MMRLLLCLLVGVSLMVVPVAHAAGILDDGCHTAHSAQKDSKGDGHSGKTASDKLAKVNHHCGCSAVSFRYEAASHERIAEPATAIITGGDVHMTSVVVGPLLKPPSHV